MNDQSTLKGGRAVSDSCFELAVRQPFCFSTCLAYLTRSPDECLYEVEGGRIRRLLRLNDPAGPLRTGGTMASSEAGDSDLSQNTDVPKAAALVEIFCPDDRALRIRYLQGYPAGEQHRTVETYVRQWFDLDRDLTPFYRMACGDPVLGELTERFYGLRLIGIPDLFEALCWAIVGQQVNLSFAYKLKRRLTETYGGEARWEGRTFRLFPEPAAIAAASVSELQQLQLTRTKAAALRETAALISRGELSRAGLLSLGSFDAAERELVRVRGIGPWTAHYVRLRCLCDPHALPVGDAGLQNAVKARMGLARKPTPEELRALFANWAGWEAYATFYLWHSLY